MTQDQGLHHWPSPTAVPEPRTPHLHSIVPVLIQVPVVPELLHAEASGQRRPRVARPGVRAHSPRRRLRREVRAAGLAILVAVPLTLACLRPLMSRPTAEGESHPPVTAADPLRPPAVSIFLEPSGLSPYVDVNPPVVLPGYLLPDDGSEEPAHAGS
jgi:hypothetical protein